jgi:hypothetical protein
VNVSFSGTTPIGALPGLRNSCEKQNRFPDGHLPTSSLPTAGGLGCGADRRWVPTHLQKPTLTLAVGFRQCQTRDRTLTTSPFRLNPYGPSPKGTPSHCQFVRGLGETGAFDFPSVFQPQEALPRPVSSHITDIHRSSEPCTAIRVFCRGRTRTRSDTFCNPWFSRGLSCA